MQTKADGQGAQAGLLETMGWGPSEKAVAGVQLLLSVSSRAVDGRSTEPNLRLWDRVTRPVGISSCIFKEAAGPPLA